MTDYQNTICRMKSELLDLWINKPVDQSYFGWYTILISRFQHHFRVGKADFYLYNKPKERFISMRKNMSTLGETTSIASDWLINDSKQLCMRQLQEAGYDDMDDFILFKDKLGEPLGLLLIQSTDYWKEFSKTPYLADFKETISRFLESIYQLNDLVMEERKFKLLFNFTEKFNSTMASEMVLDHVLETIEELFPVFPASLILSREQPGMKHAYKVFNQLTERPSTVESFLGGIVTTETNESHHLLINAPLKGRQGVYGVLQINVTEIQGFNATQKTLIQMLASTAGSALENASLYKQSHQLIGDLQLINETSRKLNSGLPFTEMIAYLKQQLSRVLLPDEIVFAFYNEQKQYTLQESTSVFFDGDEGEKYLAYVSNYIQKGKDPLFDADFGHAFSCNTTYKSVIGLPILNQEEVVGFTVCLHREKYFFSFEGFKLMRSLMMHASLSIANLQLRDRLQALSDRDYLTGLFARRYIDQYMDDTITGRKGGTFLILDVDNFKAVNDQYGHDIGDQVLKQIAACITERLEKKGVAARWGGEEFAIYLPESKRDAVELFTNNLLERIPMATEPSVTISIGGVHWKSDIVYEFGELFKGADFALYQAKAQGKNQLISKELLHSSEY